MILIPVKESPWAAQVLYELLKVRAPEENISHRVMPSYEEHLDFFSSDPYDAWYLIQDTGDYLGAAYIKNGEIGVHLFPQYRWMGYESESIELLISKHPLERYFMNVSTDNPRLAEIAMFLGGKLIQVTYEIRK